MRVLIDTDVNLDFVLAHQSFYVEAEQIFEAAARNEVEAYIASITIINIFYIGRKEKGRVAVLQEIKNLLQVVNVCPIDSAIFITSPINSVFNVSNEEKWDFSFEKIPKPMLFAQYDDALCATDGVRKHFAEILSVNFNLSGKIVIIAKTKKNYLEDEKILIEELMNTYKIPRENFKTVFIKNKEDQQTSPSIFEYWLVPNKTQ